MSVSASANLLEQTLSTCPGMLSRPVAFRRLTRAFRVSAALRVRSAPAGEGGEGPALPLVVWFHASKHASVIDAAILYLCTLI